MSYWIPYFNTYIKKIGKYDIYKNNNEVILIVDNSKVSLKNNIFIINNNIAKQIYRLSKNKIIINDIINNIEYINNKNNIKINENIYIKIQMYLEDIYFLPINHNIKIKTIKELEKIYEIELFSDVYNEYIYTIPKLYINKMKINEYENIYKYLIQNKFIGLVS